MSTKSNPSDAANTTRSATPGSTTTTAAAEGPASEATKDDSRAVFWTQAALILLLAVVTWVTIKYCSSVYYDREAAFHSVLECAERVLTDEGVDHWLQNGTLLGATRVGRLILWDADLDFGVLGRPAAAAAALTGLPAVMEKLDDLCFGHSTKEINSTVNPGLRVWRKCTRYICAEFREAQLADGGRVVRSTDGSSSADKLFPLSECTVASVGAMCPHDSAYFLAQAYGSDFLTRPLTKLF